MITSFKFNNCFAFNNEIEMTLRADMRTKRFSSNISKINENLSVLKSAVIYGPNNTGKTTLINSIKAIKGTLLNKEIYLKSNIFTTSNICEAQMSFIYENKEYLYEFKYNDEERSYIYERMCEITRDQYNNEKENLKYLRDTIKEEFKCPEDKTLEDVLNITSNNNILIYTVQIEKFPILQEIKKISWLYHLFSKNIWMIGV